MTGGIRTPDLPIKSSLDTILGNKDSGTGSETVQISVSDLAVQLETILDLSTGVLPVISRQTENPPASPADGDRYIIPSGATGVWSGQTGKVATWSAANSAYSFVAPSDGFTVTVLDEKRIYGWIAADSKWEVLTPSTLAFPTVADMNAVTGVPANYEAHVLSDVVATTVSRARSSNVATIVTTAHSLSSGQKVNIRGLGGTGYNASQVTVTVVDATTFTYANTGGNESTTADAGGQVDRNGTYRSSGSGWVWAGDPSVDPTIKTAIDIAVASEASLRVASVTAEATARDAAIAVETTARINAVANVINYFLSSAMPSGALGIWPFNNALSSPSPLVKNMQASAAPSANLLRASRRLFNFTTWWTKSNVTVVDDAVAGPDDVADASTLTATSNNWRLNFAVGASIPAGTYTLAISAKRNAASDQVFAFSKDLTATRSAPKTATSSWQRFSYTFTLTSPQAGGGICLCSSDGSTPADLQIRDFELYSGSSDLGPSAPDSHLYLGRNAYATDVTLGVGYVDLSNGGGGLIQLPTGSESGPHTVQVVVSKVAAGPVGHHPALCRAQDVTTFAASVDNNGGEPLTTGFVSYTGTIFNGGIMASGVWNALLLDTGYHVITHTYDGSYERCYFDDICMFAHAGSQASFNLRDLLVNLNGVWGIYAGLRYHGIAYWTRALSQTEVTSSLNAWKGNLKVSSGIDITPNVTRAVAFEGDSRTAQGLAYANPTFPFVYNSVANPAALVKDYAVGGSLLSTVISRYPIVDQFVPLNKNGRKFYMVIGPMGANDLNSYPGATDAIAAQNYANTLAEIADHYYSVGFDKVIVSTELSVTGSVVHDARRNLLNPIIRSSWPGANPVLVADIASDPIMGIDNSQAVNPSYWHDYGHPNTLGHTVLEPYYTAILNALP